MEDFFERAFARRYLPQWLVAGGILLLLVAGFVWWILVYENPYNVYWGMLAQSLSTSSVTKHVVENSSGSHLDQYIGQQFGTNTLAYGRTTLSTSSSTVKTENVGTLQKDYVRYTNIQTKQKNKAGHTFDFSNVLGKWAQASVANIADQSSSTPFFTQTMLGIGGGNLVPMANLSAAQRQSLLTQLHNSVVFDTSFSNVQKHKLNGRPVYTYSVKVEPVAYVGFEKAFAADVGIKALEQTDPNSYQGQQAIQVQLTVDVRSHQLAEVSYVGAQHQEFFSSYDVPLNVKIPKATISAQTLQNLVSQVQ
ncbi:MAG TPA: hypothetical protein VGG13_03510 [Candidatus Saccharimonadales bacterium]|jgi:hypothetical protein